MRVIRDSLLTRQEIAVGRENARARHVVLARCRRALRSGRTRNAQDHPPDRLGKHPDEDVRPMLTLAEPFVEDADNLGNAAH
jgi:hypothetical protein